MKTLLTILVAVAVSSMLMSCTLFALKKEEVKSTPPAQSVTKPVLPKKGERLWGVKNSDYAKVDLYLCHIVAKGEPDCVLVSLAKEDSFNVLLGDIVNTLQQKIPIRPFKPNMTLSKGKMKKKVKVKLKKKVKVKAKK